MQQPPPLPALNPYAAPVARVEDVFEDQLVLADRGVRLAAAIIDGLIIFGCWIVMSMIAAIVIPAFGKNNPAVSIAFGLIMFATFVALVAINFVLLHRYGQTVAKRMFGIKVVRADGSRCGLLRIIFARWLPITLLGLIPFVSLIDALMIFGENQRCLHDLFADTIVVKV